MTVFQNRDNGTFWGSVQSGVVVFEPMTFTLAFARTIDDWKQNRSSHNPASSAAILATEQEKLAAPRITSLSIIPTFTCNLRCGYCSLVDIPDQIEPVSMDPSQAARSIDRFSQWSDPDSSKEIMIFGGEPLCNRSVTDFIIESCNELFDCSITLFTNGTLIDDAVARFLGKHRVKVLVSLDGDEAGHNQARRMADGAGSYQLTAEGYFRARDQGCTMGLSTQLGIHNLAGFSETVDAMFEIFQPEVLSIGSSFHPQQKGIRNPFQVDPRQTTPVLLDLYYRYKARGIVIEHVDRRIDPFVTEQVKGKDCSGCGRKLVALPDGRVGFCEYLAYPGNAYLPGEQFSLATVDYQQYNRISPLFKERCLRCPAVSICGGGCFYNALMFSGSVTDLDLVNCEQTLQILDWMVETLWDHVGHHLHHEPVYLVRQPEKEKILSTASSLSIG